MQAKPQHRRPHPIILKNPFLTTNVQAWHHSFPDKFGSGFETASIFFHYYLIIFNHYILKMAVFKECPI